MLDPIEAILRLGYDHLPFMLLSMAVHAWWMSRMDPKMRATPIRIGACVLSSIAATIAGAALLLMFLSPINGFAGLIEIFLIYIAGLLALPVLTIPMASWIFGFRRASAETERPGTSLTD